MFLCFAQRNEGEKKRKKKKIKRAEANIQHYLFSQNGSEKGWGRERIEYVTLIL